MTEINSRQITVAEMAPHVHNYVHNENKTEKIILWLKNWITKSLQSGKIKPYDLLPSKAELSYHIGVSKGTLQNAIRQLENMGYVSSKQKTGTFITAGKTTSQTDKLTSKREVAVEILKKYILDNNYKIKDTIPSIRQLSQELNISNATMRLAVLQLISDGILAQKNKTYILRKSDFISKTLTTQTLATKTAEKIKQYIQNELHAGDKIPSTEELAQKYNVSIKTVYDAVKLLAKQGMLYVRRGKYGTVVLDEKETSITQTPYFYEKVEQKIRQYISENCKTGDKLPAINKIAKQYGTSEKTIKKAIDNLIQEGYLTSVRGRYGGTFVLDIPQKTKDAYKWLAITSDFIPEMEN